MSTDWICIPRDREVLVNPLKSSITYEHPLKQSTITVLESKGTRNVPLGSNPSSTGSSTLSLDPLSLTSFDGSTDPLSQFARQDAMDPLSQIASEHEETTMGKGKGHSMVENIESWSVRRTAILSRYTTSEKLTIVTSFLTGGEMIKTQTTLSEKVKNRLEQLDNFEESSMMMNLTQQEYVIKIEQLNHELVQAWNTDQRVKALKIAIQCSKLLVDTAVMQFYPSKFVLITDILDIFGKLVYERLKNKAEYIEPGQTKATALPDDFTPDMVPETAKETCMNWFYKIASIRELLPRFYVETAILRCYSFLTTTEFNAALLRLTKMIRGIGDPLVSIYARCYLCRVGMTVTSDKYYIRENLNDFLGIYQTLFNGALRGEISRQRLDISGYLSLFTPALDWIMQASASQAPDYLLEEILSRCQEKKNSGLLLITVLNTFKPEFIALRSLKFANILSNCTTTGHTRGQLLRALGHSFNRCSPPDEQKLQVLSNTWRVIATLTDSTEYIQCVEMWTQFISEHFGAREINTFLGEIILKLTANRAYENHLHELSSIIDKIFQYCKDPEAVLILDNFLPLLDLFQKDAIKVDVCKNVLTRYRQNAEPDCNISDPVMVNALMYIGQVLNDSVNALTVADERRQISALISFFIRKVDYGRDFEQQLTFYVEARAAFPNLESVFATLIHCVNRLAFDTRRIVKGQHTRKTLAFVKGCAAYCFITIPSIVSVMTKLDLYLLSGQMALLNLCLGQADACFEAAIKCIPQLPKMVDVEGGKTKSTEQYLVTYVCKFLSILILVPDSPEQGVLYLLRLLVVKVKDYSFDTSNGSLCIIYFNILDMLSVAAQETYPYHIPNVISNDDLYGSDPKFIEEINSLCSQITDLVLIQLKFFGVTHQSKIQGTLTLELFIRIISFASLKSEKMFTLAVNLWNLALKNRQSMDPKAYTRTVETLRYLIKSSKNSSHSDRLCELLNRIKTKS